MTWKEGNTIGWYSWILPGVRASVRACATSCYVGLSFEDAPNYFIISGSLLCFSFDIRLEKKV